MHHMIVAFFRSPHAGGADHLIVFPISVPGQIAIRDNGLRSQSFTNVVWIDEIQKAVAIHVCDVAVGIICETFEVREMDAHRRLVGIGGIVPVTHGIVLIEVDVIDAAIVRGHSRYHAIRLVFGAGVGHIHADAKDAQPARLIDKLELRRLKVAYNAVRSSHILGIDKGFLHGKGLPVVINKMFRRCSREDLCIRQPDRILRAFQMRIIGKGLVASQVNSCLRILGEAHDGHIVQEGVDRLLLLLPGPVHRIVGFRYKTQFLGAFDRECLVLLYEMNGLVQGTDDQQQYKQKRQKRDDD